MFAERVLRLSVALVGGEPVPPDGLTEILLILCAAVVPVAKPECFLSIPRIAITGGILDSQFDLRVGVAPVDGKAQPPDRLAFESPDVRQSAR